MNRILACSMLIVVPSCAPEETCDAVLLGRAEDRAKLTRDECEELASIVLPDALPPAPGNRAGDDLGAALLGFQVFFDRRFSANQEVRCVSCHMVEHGFADAEPASVAGLEPGTRNSPTLLNAARYSTFLWDGGADTLWSQPLMAFENPREMDFTRLEIAHRVAELYAADYEAVFGPLPDLGDGARFPPRGRPGDEAYDSMSAADQDAVDEVVANLGKALEAYMRRIASGPSRVDRYLARSLEVPRSYASEEEPVELSEQERRGLGVLVSAGCLECHSGPQLSDGAFHDLGVPALPGSSPDSGRDAAVVARLEASPFNRHGAYFDGPAEALPIEGPVPGGFRTPSLRNLGRSAPYGHNGVFPTLEEVLDFHLRGGGEAGPGEVDPLLRARELSPEDQSALIELLNAFQGDYPPLPWGQWPSGNG